MFFCRTGTHRGPCFYFFGRQFPLAQSLFSRPTVSAAETRGLPTYPSYNPHLLIGKSCEAAIVPPADFGKLIADETEKWGKVIRAANIKPQ